MSSGQTKVVLVACSKTKLSVRAKARDMYQGALFRKSVAYAEALRLPWAVVSTKHGLLTPDQVVEPYSETFSRSAGADGSYSAEGRLEWAARVNGEIEQRYGRHAELLSLLSEPYEGCLAGFKAERPLAGMAIGNRLRWLSVETGRLLQEDMWTR